MRIYKVVLESEIGEQAFWAPISAKIVAFGENPGGNQLALWQRQGRKGK